MNVIISNKFEALLGSLEIDVIKKVTGEYEVDEIISMFSNFFYQRMLLDITSIKDYRNVINIQKLSIALDMDKVILVLDDTPESTSSLYLSKLISMGIYNFTKNKEGILYLLQHPNTYRDVAHIHQLDSLTNEVKERIEKSSIKILGIKNLTDQAGATSLIFMLKKQLSSNYKVVALEVDKRDFMYFNDKDMVSTTSQQFSKELMVLSDAYDVILVDLNTSSNEDACNDVLYLIEPSTIKLNKMMKKNKNIFEQMKNKKIVLNKSFLDSKDIMDFEVEANAKVYFNVPPLNERAPSKILDNFLVKLGFLRQASLENDKEDSKVLGLFKF